MQKSAACNFKLSRHLMHFGRANYTISPLTKYILAVNGRPIINYRTTNRYPCLFSA